MWENYSYKWGKGCREMVLKRKYVALILSIMILLFVLCATYVLGLNYRSIIMVGVVFISILLGIMAFQYQEKFLKRLSVVTILSIFLTPSVTMGANFRLEDYLVVFMALTLFSIALKKNHKKLTLVVGVYLLYSIIITTINYFSGNVKPIYYLFLVKEIQFFFYFYFMMYAVDLIKNEEKLYKVLYFLSIANISWGIIQVLTPINAGFYGIGVINDTSPSQSGGIFVVTTLFLLFYRSHAKHKNHLFLTCLLLLSILMTVFVGSRTSIMALVVCFSFLFLIKFIKFLVNFKMTRKTFRTIGIIILLMPAMIIWFTKSDMYNRIFGRISRLGEGTNIRTSKWERLFNQSDPNFIEMILGKGKGYTQELTGGLTLAADSQYMRLFLETGIVGLVTWLMIIAFILYIAIKGYAKAKDEAKFLILLVLAFCTMGITHEVFLVALQASAFWSISGLMVGVIIKKYKEERHSF